MCKVYNSIGSLTAIKFHLHRHNLNEFKSVNELLHFQKNYSVAVEQIISSHSLLIKQEKGKLELEIARLNEIINTTKNQIAFLPQLQLDKLNGQLASLSQSHKNFFRSVNDFFKKETIKLVIIYRKKLLNAKIRSSLSRSTNELAIMEKRYLFIDLEFEKAVSQSSSLELLELKRKKRIIDELSNLIYGALGEQKVVRELENLPDDYILINDFTCLFNSPIYNRQENDYIKSIQIDHILISPAGIFLIETKNWSEHSLKNLNLWSPVQQIKRTSFALFKLLAGEVANSGLSLNRHHWGLKKVPIKNLIVLINHKPKEEFQYVKVLTLKELPGYIKYFPPIFSNYETEMIADYLLSINGRFKEGIKPN